MGIVTSIFRTSHASPSSPLESPLGAALQDYTAQTGTKLDGHPITETLKKCDSADSVTSVIQNHARSFHEFEGDAGSVMKPIKYAVQVLHTLSTGAVSGEGISLNRPVCPTSFHLSSFSLMRIP